LRRRPGIIRSISGYLDQTSPGAYGPDGRVAILYNDASTFTVSTMESAEQYAKDLGLTPLTSSYNGTGYTPGRVLPLLLNVKQQGIRWLLVIALDPDGLDAAQAIQREGLDLDIKYVTAAPANKIFRSSIGTSGAEFYTVGFELDRDEFTWIWRQT
jgi:hypothetical protein